MIEFKYDRKRNEFFLIEVNPKFWGSILLPIVAGINFPVNYVKLLETSEVNENCRRSSYKKVRLQHVVSDFSRALKYKVNLKETFQDFFNLRVKKDMFYLGIGRYIIFYVGKHLL